MGVWGLGTGVPVSERAKEGVVVPRRRLLSPFYVESLLP